MGSICVISDFISNDKLDPGILAMMGKTMKHRGADDTGIYLGKNAIMHHNRLSIIDAQGGKQPMTAFFNDKKYTIAYNGEIFNSDELREELSKEDVVLSTRSDTELVLWSYIVWGDKSPEHLDGIFAYVIYDEYGKKLFMARDRFGVKPLFYSFSGSTLFVASEMKALLAHPAIKPKVDKTGLWQLLFLSPVTLGSTTVFRDIYELSGGEYATFGSGGLKIHKYWQLKASPFTDSREEAIYKTKDLLIDSVRRQLRSDVPVCQLLSGGLDSSAITAIASKIARENGTKTDTYSFEYEGNKESFKSTEFQPQGDDEFATDVSSFLNTNHTVLTIGTKDLAGMLKAAVDARDFPGQADIDSSLLYFCTEIKKQHTVALTGECSDEICGGYPWFYREEMLNRDFFPWIHDPFARVSLFKEEIALPRDGYDYLSERYRSEKAGYSVLEEDTAPMRNSRIATNLSLNFFGASLLERKDRMGMAAGIEARAPFADHKFAEYMYNVPWEIKFEGGVEKALLRNAMSDYLPSYITRRKKSPYPKSHNPEYEKLVTEMIESELKRKDTLFSELIDKAKINDMLSSDGATWFGQLMAKPQLIAWLCQFAYWLEKYNIVLV